MTKKNIENIIFLSPLILFVTLIFIKLYSQSIYVFLIREDSLLEYSQALFYFLSAVIASFTCIKFFQLRFRLHVFLFAILAIGMLLIALEEISWGQRILGYSNPHYFNNNNVQREVSLHNLSSIQPHLKLMYLIVGLYGTVAWIFVSLFNKILSKSNIIRHIAPDFNISLYFFFGFFIYFALHGIRYFELDQEFQILKIGNFLKWRDEEFAEFFLASGFLLFNLEKLWIVKNLLRNTRTNN